MKFRKKPVEIEAIQWDGTAAGATAVIGWVLEHPAVQSTPSYYAPGEWDDETNATYLNIPTLEGNMLASPGDWIIIGVENELYPCKPAIFEQTYTDEDVDELTPAVLTAALAWAAERVFEVNEANGWFEEDRTVGEDIALLHSEASEMLEAYRNWGLEDATERTHNLDGSFRNPKPEGFGSEAADVLIRLFDTCLRRDVSLGYEFERKLAFNASRGHRHGGKRL